MSIAGTLQSRLTGHSLAVLTILASCLFSLIVILQHPVLNDDAFGYLRAAELFQAGEGERVLRDYGWYGYSLLIALLDLVLPGGMIAAAHTLNTLAYGLLAWSFLQLCREHGDSPRLQAFAALTILACPLINEMRYFLIRDAAFWAFALLSLVYLLRFNHSGLQRHAALWCITLLAASLFRLDGLLLLVLTPAGLLFPRALQAPARQRQWRLAVQAWTFALGAMMAAMLLGLALGVDLPALATFAWRYYIPELVSLGSVLADSITAANAGIFTPDNFPRNDDVAVPLGFLVLIFAYALALLANLAKALSLPVAAVLLWAWLRNRLVLSAPAKGPLLAYLATSLFALLLFLLIMHFLTQRYATLPALLLLSLLPPALDALYGQLLIRGHARRFRILFAVCLLFLFGDGLVSFGHSPRHIVDATAWTRDGLPAGATLLTNELPIAHGSGMIPEYDRIERDIPTLLDTSAPGDYLVLSVRRGDSPTRTLLDTRTEMESVVGFANSRGDEVRVLRRR